MLAESRKKYNVSFDLLDLKSFKRNAPNHGWAYIIFILKDGTTYPALHFHNGGSKAMLQQFGKYIHIKRLAIIFFKRNAPNRDHFVCCPSICLSGCSSVCPSVLLCFCWCLMGAMKHWLYNLKQLS